MATFNALVGLRDIFSPTTADALFHMGVVVYKSENSMSVRNSASGAVLKVFGSLASLGDTIIFKDRQFVGVIGKDNTKIIDIE